jgi:thiol-disulfide isomerase/thioredoxin
MQEEGRATMKGSAMASWAAVGALAVVVAVVAVDRAPKARTAGAKAPPVALGKTASAAKPQPRGAAPDQPQQNQQYTLHFVKNPEPVPGFNVTSFSGQTLTPAAWRGKVVILNFWATWCGPCRYEIPELINLQQKFQGSLQVIGLSVDEAPPDQVKTFIGRFGVNYPVGMASEKLQGEFGGILALPTSFVIDRQGRVVQKHVGLVPEDYYSTEISYLAGRQVNAKVESFTDVGQVFPANVKNATSLPGVDMSRLTPAQRKIALKKLNQMHCTCGCDYTIAQCRLLDSACPVSKKEAQEVVDQIARGAPPKKAATTR